MNKLDEYKWLERAGKNLDMELEAAAGRFRKSVVVTCISVFVLLLLSYFLSGSGTAPAVQLIRNQYGEQEKEIVINAEITAGGQSYEKEMNLSVKPMAVSRENADILFDECAEWLKTEIIPEDQVSGDMILPKEYGDGLVILSWHSSDPLRISEEGAVNLLKMPPVCYVTLTATMSVKEFSRDCSFLLHVVEGDMSKTFERTLEDLERDLSVNEDGDRLDLPTLYDGAQIRWNFPGKAAAWEIIPIGGLLLLALYFSRYDSVEKKLKAAAREFEYEIPSMTLQLILLLNAGLVLSAAFDQLILQNEDNEHPLYKALGNIRDRCRAENLSFADELSLFARHTGCRDFIRIASLIADHSSHGSELASKLEQERERLWSGRLSAAKSRTKEAETKLCLPLMVLLLVLVVISAAPALMTM